jgi:hypothetical protein
MKQEKLDKRNFMIHFNAALTNKTVGNLFLKFLKSEFNEEPWNFLNQINLMKELKEKGEKMNKIEEIIQDYLLKDSKYEINVSGKLKTESNLKFKDFTENEKEIDELNGFFKDIVKVLHGELFHDPWKRFIRSKYCDEIIKQFQLDPSVCSPQITQYFSYSDDYFKQLFIEDDDFKFAFLLFEDNFHWEVIHFIFTF